MDSINDFKELKKETSDKLKSLKNLKESLQKEFGAYYEIPESKYVLDLKSRKGNQERVFKHLHQSCLVNSEHFIHSNKLKLLSLLDFYFVGEEIKNPLAIYNATRSIIELTAFLNDISVRLLEIYNENDTKWISKGEQFFGLIIRARFGTSNKEFIELLKEDGLSEKKLKPINIMRSIEVLENSNYSELASQYHKMCDYVHHNLSSNTAISLGSSVTKTTQVLNKMIQVGPGTPYTAYRYPLTEKGNMAIEMTLEVVENCTNAIIEIINKTKQSPFSEELKNKYTGNNSGVTYISQNKSKKVKNVKYGRNDKCFCGSGKKYKHCHGGILLN